MTVTRSVSEGISHILAYASGYDRKVTIKAMDTTSKPTLLHLPVDAVVERLMLSGQLADLEHVDLKTIDSEVVENIGELQALICLSAYNWW